MNKIYEIEFIDDNKVGNNSWIWGYHQSYEEALSDLKKFVRRCNCYNTEHFTNVLINEITLEDEPEYNEFNELLIDDNDIIDSECIYDEKIGFPNEDLIEVDFSHEVVEVIEVDEVDFDGLCYDIYKDTDNNYYYRDKSEDKVYELTWSRYELYEVDIITEFEEIIDLYGSLKKGKMGLILGELPIS